MKTYFKKVCKNCKCVIAKSNTEVDHQTVNRDSIKCPNCGAVDNELWFSNPKLQK